MAGPVLSARGISVRYGHRQILHSVDFDIRAGEILALLGRNGAGKSTTLLAVAGFVPEARGDIRLNGVPLRGPAYQRARVGLGLVIKGRSLFASLSVADNLRLADLHPDALLTLFPELLPRLNVPAGQLSGGEQQMVAVARALLRRPRAVLLDELTFGLSPAMSARVADVVVGMARQDGIAILAVEQHVHVAERIGTHAAVIGDGGIQLHLTKAELTARAREIEADYLGYPIDA